MAEQGVPKVRAKDARWLNYLRLGGLLVALVVVIAFIVENSARTTVHFFTLGFSFPLWLLLLIVALLGLLIGWLVTWQRLCPKR